MIPRRAVVLAAGLGTRLRPFSLRLPKPAWPFFDQPLAGHALRALADAGVREAWVNLHHLPGELRAALDPFVPPGLAVFWSVEREILGTGGALLPLADALGGEPFWLVNGDTYREFDLAGMARFHARAGGAATLGLSPAPAGSPAPIEADEETGRIVRFLDARAPQSRPGLPCEFPGVHLLSPLVLDAARRVGKASFCVNADVHRHLVAEGTPLFGWVERGAYWSDLGAPDRYLAAHRALLEAGRLPPGTPGLLVSRDETTPEGGRIVAPSYLGAGARVEEGATLGPFGVLGAGATARAGARLEESVVWPGTTLSAPLLRRIAAPWGEAMGEAGETEKIL